MRRIYLILVTFFLLPCSALGEPDFIESIAVKYAEALTNQNLVGLSNLFDYDTLAYTASYAMSQDKSQRERLRLQLLLHDEQRLLSIWNSDFFSVNGKAKYVRMIEHERQKRPLLRLDQGAKGFDFIILYINFTSKKGWQVSDYYSASKGKTMSQILSDSAAEIARLLESNVHLAWEPDRVLFLNNVEKINKLRIEGKFAEAYSILGTLHEEIRNSRLMIDMGIAIAANLNLTLYYQEVERLDKHFGDNKDVQFILVSYHLARGNHERGQILLNRLIEHYGRDASLLALKSYGHFIEKNYEAGVLLGKEAIAADKDYQVSYLYLADNLVGSKEYKEAILVYKTLKSRFGYQFNKQAFQKEKFYAELAKSPEFKSWDFK